MNVGNIYLSVLKNCHVNFSWLFYTGASQFYDVIELMIGYRINRWIYICWKFITPALTLVSVYFFFKCSFPLLILHMIIVKVKLELTNHTGHNRRSSSMWILNWHTCPNWRLHPKRHHSRNEGGKHIMPMSDIYLVNVLMILIQI